MVDFLPEHHEAIRANIGRFLKEKRADLSRINSWGADLCNRLNDFVCSGKMLRGKLVLLTYLMYRHSIEDAVLDAAAAIEIFHSSLLIHDDIIDSDLLRRGHHTLFAQYQKWGEDHELFKPSRFGQSMGICAGDIGFMLSFDILSQLNAAFPVINKLLQLFTKEMSYVGLAQMQEIFFASSNGVVDETSVYNLYVYKTARYTFSLPMIAGALLAGQNTQTQDHLGEIGKSLGIIFQIRDDALGLFGDESELGKPICSDLREGKQTLYYLALIRKACEEHKKKLYTILRKQNIDFNDVSYIRRLIIELGVREEIDSKVAELSSQIRKLINSNEGIDPVCRQTLLRLTEYIVNREK